METTDPSHIEVVGHQHQAAPARPLPTAAPDGISPDEVKRLHGCLHLMKTYAHHTGLKLWWATSPAGSSAKEEADFRKRITKQQGIAGIQQYYVAVFEAEPAKHSHTVFVGTQAVVDPLLRSKFCGHRSPFCNFVVDPVTELDFLARGYLIEERNSKADYKRRYPLRRIRNADRIHGGKIEGGGDRVRPSEALTKDALTSGLIVAWTKKNSKRKPVEDRRPHPRAMLLPVGQVEMFPDKPTRLRDFGGGMIPHPVAIQLEFKRNLLGLSQREIARRAGILQGTYANAIRGHDPISVWAMNRLRDALLA